MEFLLERRQSIQFRKKIEAGLYLCSLPTLSDRLTLSDLFLKLFEEPFLLEFLQKVQIDEVLGLFGFRRRHALSHFLDGVADALHVWLNRVVGHLQKAL